MCEHIAQAHGLTATVDYRVGYPVTVNDSTETQRVGRLARELFGPQAYFEAPRSRLRARVASQSRVVAGWTAASNASASVVGRRGGCWWRPTSGSPATDE